MSNFDEALQKKQDATANKPMKMSSQERNEQRIAELNEAAKKAVSSVDNFQSYLAVQSRFDRYSANNNLLIFAQRPDATRLKGMDLWNKEKARVNKGAKSIHIYEPKKVMKDGKEYTNFERKSMFDISNVSGAEPENHPAYSLHDVVKALFKHKAVEVKTIPDYPENRQYGALYDTNDKCIYAKCGMNEEQIFTSVTVALAHAEMSRGVEDYATASHAFEARCAAYILAKKYGVPTDALKIERIPDEYASMDAANIRESLARIHDAAKAIDSGMYKALVKENEVSPKSKSARGGDAR